MGERIDVEAEGQRVKGKGQKGERNKKDGRVEGKKEHGGGKEGRCMGKKKERKEDGEEEKEGEETRQRRNSCCYLSADDLQRGRATDLAAA